MAPNFREQLDADTLRDIDLIVKEAGRMVRDQKKGTVPRPEAAGAADRMKRRLAAAKKPDVSVGALLGDRHHVCGRL
jgi:hypothetical protein